MGNKAGFAFGLVSGIAVLSLAALAFVLTRGIGPSAASSNNTAPAVAAAPSPVPAPIPEAPAGDPAPISEEDHIRGDKNAPLTWIEYSDFECPFCKAFHPSMQKMLEEFDGKIKLVYRHFPLSFHDPLATKEAEASECANELGGNDAFWKMHDEIFARTQSNGNGMAVSELDNIAAEIGLNADAFKTCMESGKYVQHIQSQISEGSLAGVTGTPGSFLVDEDGNAQLVSGAVPYAQIQALINAAL